MASIVQENQHLYENSLPAEGDLVIIKILDVTDSGVNVSLPEYAQRKGLMPLSEVSRRRVKNIKNLLRPIEVATVLRVDPIKGYIDVSMKQVTPTEIQSTQDRWSRSKMVHSILYNLSTKTSISLEDLYRQLGWPLYRRFGHAFFGFQQANPEILKEYQLSESTIEHLLGILHQQLPHKKKKIVFTAELTCFTEEGIDGIIKAIQAGLDGNSEKFALEIHLISSPLYQITAITELSEEEGILEMNKCRERIQAVIEAAGGTFKMRDAIENIIDT